MSGIGSIWHWLILLLIVGLVCGTKRLRNMGDDLGAAIKGFRKGVQGPDDQAQLTADPPGQPENAEVTSKLVDSKEH